MPHSEYTWRSLHDEHTKDAELHAEEDRKKKELIDARNHLDGLVYTVEKSLKDFGDKVDSATKASVEEALKKAKDALNTNDINTIKSATEELMQKSHSLAEIMYKQAQSQQAGTQATGSEQKKEDVVDATYEEVKDK